MNVILTDTAKTKGFRLLSNGRLKHIVENMDGRLYKERDEGERYLLIHDDPEEGEIWIHFVKDGGDIVVVTYRHPHGDSPTNDEYAHVPDHERAVEG